MFIYTSVEISLLQERRHNCEVLLLEEGDDTLARSVHVQVVGGGCGEPFDLVSWGTSVNVIYKVKCGLRSHAVVVWVQDAGSAHVLPVREFLLISTRRSLFVDWFEENVRGLNKTVSWPVDHGGRLKWMVQGYILALKV